MEPDLPPRSRLTPRELLVAIAVTLVVGAIVLQISLLGSGLLLAPIAAAVIVGGLLVARRFVASPSMRRIMTAVALGTLLVGLVFLAFLVLLLFFLFTYQGP